MRKKKSIQLFAGKFSATDARDVLINLISYKINFHPMKNFSQQVRFDKTDSIRRREYPNYLKTKSN